MDGIDRVSLYQSVQSIIVDENCTAPQRLDFLVQLLGGSAKQKQKRH